MSNSAFLWYSKVNYLFIVKNQLGTDLFLEVMQSRHRKNEELRGLL